MCLLITKTKIEGISVNEQFKDCILSKLLKEFKNREESFIEL